MDIRQTYVSTAVSVGQTCVIHSQLVQNCGPQIINRTRVFHRVGEVSKRFAERNSIWISDLNGYVVIAGKHPFKFNSWRRVYTNPIPRMDRPLNALEFLRRNKTDEICPAEWIVPILAVYVAALENAKKGHVSTRDER